MTLEYDLFWAFRSPYSYLVTPRLIALERDYDVRAIVRPVLPIAVRQPDFFTGSDPLWFSYLLRDIARIADFVGMPIRWPRPTRCPRVAEERRVHRARRHLRDGVAEHDEARSRRLRFARDHCW